MKKYLYILIFIISSLFSDFYSLSPKPLVQYKTHLAISINPNCNSQYVNYAIMVWKICMILKTNMKAGHGGSSVGNTFFIKIIFFKKNRIFKDFAIKIYWMVIDDFKKRIFKTI